jgi:hypothetical protein
MPCCPSLLACGLATAAPPRTMILSGHDSVEPSRPYRLASALDHYPAAASISKNDLSAPIFSTPDSFGPASTVCPSLRGSPPLGFTWALKTCAPRALSTLEKCANCEKSRKYIFCVKGLKSPVLPPVKPLLAGATPFRARKNKGIANSMPKAPNLVIIVGLIILV